MLGGPRAVTPGFENHEINQFKAECLFVVALPSLKMSVGFKPKAPFGSVPPFSVPQLGLAFWPRDAAMQRCTPRRWGTGKTWQINFLGPFLLTEFLARRREAGPDGTWSAGRFFLGQPKMANGQPHSPQGVPNIVLCSSGNRGSNYYIVT